MTEIFGTTVVRRAEEILHERGSYIKTAHFKEQILGAGIEEMEEVENVRPNLVGLAVDYLTRFLSFQDKEQAFCYSLIGAHNYSEEDIAREYLEHVKNLDDDSILHALKLVDYDICYRANGEPSKDINPDSITISHIRIMVKRSLAFIEQYGPILLEGITFKGGYTHKVRSGDADFLTKDTLYDFKVSKKKPTGQNVNQILLYYRMGVRSIHQDYFKDLQYLGFFNPRRNAVYRYPIDDIDGALISEIDLEGLGYEEVI